MSSATRMNSPAATRPRSGCCQRDERLEPRHPPGGELDLRLVGDTQLAFVERRAQLGLELLPLRRACPQRLPEHLVAGAAALLRAVHRKVGVMDQRVGIRAAIEGERDPDAARERDLAPRDRERRRERLRHPLRELRGVVAVVERRSEHRELVAAETGDRVSGTQGMLETVADLHEQLVARDMPEAVVHLLEAVEVDEEDPDPGRGPADSGERLQAAVAEERPVREPGERVVQRLVRELSALSLHRVDHRAPERLRVHVSLVEIVLNARLHGFHGQAAVLHPGQHDDRGVGRKPPDRLHGVEPVGARQQQVEQDAAVAAAVLERGHGVAQRRRPLGGEVAAEHVLDQLGIALVVLDDEDRYGIRPWAHVSSVSPSSQDMSPVHSRIRRMY